MLKFDLQTITTTLSQQLAEHHQQEIDREKHRLTEYELRRKFIIEAKKEAHDHITKTYQVLLSTIEDEIKQQKNLVLMMETTNEEKKDEDQAQPNNELLLPPVSTGVYRKPHLE